MPFPAKVKLCTESLQSWTRCRGQARLRTTSQALRASSPSRGASGEKAKLYGMPRPPLARGGGIASAMTERLDKEGASPYPPGTSSLLASSRRAVVSGRSLAASIWPGETW